MIQINNVETIKKYYNKSKEISNAILNKNSLSVFNDDVLKINNHYKINAIGGYFGRKHNINLNELCK